MNQLNQIIMAIRRQGSHPFVIHLVTILLLFFSCYQLGILTWKFFPNHDHATSSEVESQPNIIATHPDQLSELQSLHLFGVAPERISQHDSRAPTTQLPIVLNGVLFSSDPDKALAVIARAGKQLIYGPGEKIEGTQAKVERIYPTFIVLNRSGHRERLYLPNSRSVAPVPLKRLPPLASANFPSVRDILADPAQINQYFDIKPEYSKQHRLLGYKLQPGPDPQLFHRLGFQPGDLVLSINGYHVNDTQSVMKLVRNFPSSGNCQIIVLRQGMRVTMNLRLPS
ncbi:MAG: Type II secretion system protein C [Candidatus Celerinatantimonas neptuna]|nr:MAG: Type II secretion system protein C [Candidatus Celerinatantimonas neptuna]